jgi:hypothetical protein
MRFHRTPVSPGRTRGKFYAADARANETVFAASSFAANEATEDRSEGGLLRRKDPSSRGIPLSYARDLRPLAAGSARRICTGWWGHSSPVFRK